MGGARSDAIGRNRLYGLLLTSAASISALMTLPALAQTASGDQPAAASGGLEEIIVTARKRSEDIQKTPVSITALSAADISREQIRDLGDLRGLVPGMEVTPESNYGSAVNSIAIRGITQESFVTNLDPGVGFYMNDLYVARPEGQSLGLFDLSNIQVLKGPQGTLFGKNTIGGAVLVTTQVPTDDFEGYADFKYGSFNYIYSEGAINIPIIRDKVDFRVSFATTDMDGYIKDLLDSGTKDDKHEKNVRLQLRVKPTDDLTIDLLGEYNYHHDNGTAAIETACSNSQYAVSNYNGAYAIPNGLPPYCNEFPPLGKQYTVYGTPHAAVPTGCLPGGYRAGNCDPYFGNEAAFTKVEVYTLEARINYQIDEHLNIKSVTGFRRSDLNDLGGEYDDGGSPECIYCEEDNTTTQEWSQEVNLNGNYWDGALTFVVGAIYVDQNSGFAQNTGPDFDGDPTGYSFLQSENFESDAVYAQGSYKVTDDLELTLGGRYSYDTKTVQSVLLNDLGVPTYKSNGEVTARYVCYYKTEYPSCPAYYAGPGGTYGYENGAGSYYIPGPGAAARQRASSRYYDFDPTGKISYQFTPDFLAYGSVTGGYQSGGFNTQLGPGIGTTNGMIPFGKERVWDYEGGLKTQWFERRLRIDVTGYYQDFKNIQTTVENPFLQIPTRYILNASEAHEDGVELEIDALPTPDLAVKVTGDYLDQGFDKLSPAVEAVNAYLVAKGEAPALTLQDPVTTAPKFTASISVDYTYHLPWEATLVGDLTYQWVDTRVFQIDNRLTGALAEASPYYLVNAKLMYVAPDSSYQIGIWGKNLTGKYYANNVCNDYCLGLGPSLYWPGMPRQIGLEIKYNFKSEAAPEETGAVYTPPPPQAPMPAPSVAHSYMVFFDFNKSDLSPQAVTIVDQAAKNAAPAKATELTVTGHTDTVGSEAYNMRLSRRRAESVAAELEKQGIASSEIEIVAKGKHDLLVPTGDGVREPQNRRVTIVYGGGVS
jgi:iron complex outermembrane receptor protein